MTASSVLSWLLTLPWTMLRKIFSEEPEDLRNKVVLLTGASSGIGEALAHKFYAQGCRLILSSRQVDELNRVKDDLLRSHSTVPTHVPVVIPLDLVDIDSLPKVVERVLDICGRIDVLVNNGGISYRGKILDTTAAVDMRIMMVNYFGQIALTKAVLSHMIQRKSGSIVFMNSLQGRVVMPYRSSYGASKHALTAFGDVLRCEVAKYNVRVHSIYPSYVRTNLSKNALTSDGSLHGKMDTTTRKGCSPETVADSVIDTLIYRRNECVVAPIHHWFYLYGRTMLSSLYFWILSKFERSEAERL